MKNVIIIGGGVAGLGAAWRLSEQGYNVKVLVIENRIFIVLQLILKSEMLNT